MRRLDTDERLQILRLVEAGTISAKEGARLLEALGGRGGSPRPPAAATAARWLRIRVRSGDGDHVSVNLPLQLAEAALRLVPRQVLRDAQLEPEALLAMIGAVGEAGGKIVEVTAADGTQVEIFVE